jgi:hypothetical protein
MKLLIILLRKRVIKRSKHAKPNPLRRWRHSCDYCFKKARFMAFEAFDGENLPIGQSCYWDYGALLRDFALHATEIRTVTR